MISRLAPTPSGYLHWGNLLNFALTRSRVRKAGGILWLRIDDVDATRMRTEYVEDLFETLRWLGFDWDRGPRDAAEFFASHSQSLRKAEYFSRLQALPVYACDCSRQTVQQRTGGDASYDGHCRDRGIPFRAGETALRLPLGDGFPDPLLWTKDDLPAYHWVSILDDLRMGTTHLIRGEDLREPSRIQSEIARVIPAPEYARIEHVFHPLLLGADGKKLSKSAGSDSLRGFRKRGVTAEDAWKEFSRVAGLHREIRSLEEFSRSS